MPRPALRALIPYTLGIFIAGFLSIPLFWLWLIALSCLISSLALQRLSPLKTRHSTSILRVAIFAGGMLRLGIVLTSPIPTDFYDQPVRFSGRMTYQPDRGESWDAGYAVGTIHPVAAPDLAVKAKLLIRFREPVELGYGDHLDIEGELRQPKGQRNPGGFDYRSYLARHQVFGILYPHRNQQIKSSHQAGFLPFRWTEKLRRRVDSVINDVYPEFLFSVELERQTDLDYDGILEILQEAFEHKKIALSQNSTVEVKGDSKWLITDKDNNHQYSVEKKGNIIYIYSLNHALVIKGMLLGQRDALPEKVLKAFENSGVLHILAVSGLHFGLIAVAYFTGFVLLRPPRKPMPRKLVCVLTIAAIILYACLVGFRASVLRASLMASLFLIAQIIDRDADLINLLAFAALVLLLISPAQLWDVGFQLSFAAVGAIVYLTPKWTRFTERLLPNRIDQTTATNILFLRLNLAWRRAVKWLLIAFGVSLSAQLGTSLLIAYHFYRVYPISLIASIFAVGLATFIVSIALVSVLLGLIWIPFATMFVAANHLILSGFLKGIEFFGQPEAVIKTAPPSFGFIVVYIAGCLTVAHWRWVWEQRKKATLIGLAITAIWIWDAAIHDRGNLLEITFLDVGQGDAAFVRFPDGKTMLIDGGLNMRGYDSGERILEPFLLHQGVRQLDLLLLSHPDNDHGGGFAHILREFNVKRVIGVPHRNLPPPTHRMLHEIVDEKGVPHELGYAGEIDLTPTARLELLHPYDEASTNLTDRDVNNDSLVLKLTYGDLRILFAGDIEQETEQSLIASGGNLRAEILKVPHHGSRTSSSAEFLDAVRPQYAIFSLGARNRYGFPAETVVKRYRERGCRVLRTDQLGAIQLRTDGRRCWLTYHVGLP